MTRRNPPSAKRRRIASGPPHAEAIAWRRGVLLATRGCPPGTDPDEVRRLRRWDAWWMGVDPRAASDAYVAAAFLLGVAHDPRRTAWRADPAAEAAALRALAEGRGGGGRAC